MGRFLEVTDLQVFASDIDVSKAEAMIEDAENMALLVAPCLDNSNEDYDLTIGQEGAVKAVLRAAVLRWNDSGTGAFQQQQTGPFGVTLDTRQARKSMFWPSEIEQLQEICQGEEATGAFSIDTGISPVVHADICAVNFGAIYCSCGASLTNYMYPLYEYTEDFYP